MSANSLSNLLVFFAIFVSAINLVLFSISLAQNKNNTKIDRIALNLNWLIAIFLAVALVLRGVAAQRAPWGNMYEFAIASACAIILAFAIISIKKDYDNS